MKVFLMGKNLDDIAPLLPQYDFSVVPTIGDAELLIAHGGDGTLLQAVRAVPADMPIWPIRDAATAKCCPFHDYRKLLERFQTGNIRLRQMPKLVGSYGGESRYAINDIFIHNETRFSALRYQVLIDDELYANEIVGDGVGMATVHGSTAYYRSITHSIFRVGVGLAFSNSTEEVSHLVLPENVRVKIRIVRGPGCMIADNSPDFLRIPEGGEVLLQQASGKALVYGIMDFMCPECRLLRHPNKYPAHCFARYAEAHPQMEKQ